MERNPLPSFNQCQQGKSGSFHFRNEKRKNQNYQNGRPLEIVYTERALKERDFWKKSGDKKIQKRISLLLEAIILDPEKGIGKPEMLRENLSGFWSRRITQIHRLVYSVDLEAQKIVIISMRFHY